MAEKKEVSKQTKKKWRGSMESVSSVDIQREDEENPSEMDDVSSDSGGNSSLIEGGQAPNIIPKAANIPIWDIAQKELDSVQELRKLKMKWTQWQRTIVKQEYSKRWLALKEKEADSVSPSIIETVIDTVTKLVKYSLDMIYLVNDNMNGIFSNYSNSTKDKNETVESVVSKFKPKIELSVKYMKKYLRKLALKGAQIIGSRQDKNISGVYKYDSILKDCLKEIKKIPHEGESLFPDASLEDLCLKITELGTFRRAYNSSIGLQGLLSQIIYVFLTLTSAKPEASSFIYFVAILRSFKFTVASLLNSLATISLVSSSKITYYTQLKNSMSPSLSPSDQQHSPNSSDAPSEPSSNSNTNARTTVDNINIWKERTRTSMKIDWNALDDATSPPTSAKNSSNSSHKRSSSSSSGLPIAGATVNKLVEKLTSEENISNSYQQIFLSCYPTFATSSELITKLKERYNVPSNYIGKLTPKQIQLRVCVFIHVWIQTKVDDMSDTAVAELVEFINSTVRKDNPDMSVLLIKELEEKQASYQAKIKHALSIPQISLTIPQSDLTIVNLFLSFSPLEIARQLTILDSKSFQSVETSELLNQAWLKPSLQYRCPNLLRLLSRARHVSKFVRAVVLCPEQPDMRTKLMTKFAQVMGELQQIANFQTLNSVLTGIKLIGNSKTAPEVTIPQQIVSQIQGFDKLFNPDKSYKNYKNALSDVDKASPCLPYIQIVLADFAQIDEKYPDNESGLVNFVKREMLYEQMQIIQRYQQIPYNFVISDPLHSFFQELPISI